MKPGLKSLEDSFQSFVLRGSPGIESYVALDTIASAAQRLDVYFQAYRLRLVEALGNDYPGLKGFVGDAEFERLAHAYIDRHPSRERSIRWFGRSFAQFLRSRPRDDAHPAPADIAAFEWARGEVFDEADAPLVTTKAIAALAPEDWPELRLTLSPAVRRLHLQWNAPAICKTLAAGEPAPAPESNSSEWLLWRRELEVHWRSLDVAEAHAFDAAAAGAGFGEICESLLDHLAVADVALRAAGLLKLWAADGLIAGLSVQESTAGGGNEENSPGESGAG